MKIPAMHKYRYLKCDKSKCYYCARPSQAWDHVLPLSLAEALPYEPWPDDLLLLVPACTQCNSIARDKLFKSLDAKAKFIRARLRARILSRVFGASMCNECLSYKIEASM